MSKADTPSHETTKKLVDDKKNVDPHHGKHEKRKSFWRHPYFFHHVALNLALILLVWGVIIVWLPYLGPKIEKWLFPSSQHIEKLQQEWAVLNGKVEELDHQLSGQKDQLEQLPSIKRQVETLEEAVTNLSRSLKGLDEKLSSSKLPSQVSEPNSSQLLKDLWSTIIQHFEKGESFQEQLHALIPFVEGDKNLLGSLYTLSEISGKPTKTIQALSQELRTVYESLSKPKSDKREIKSEATSWWHNIKDRILALVQIRRLGDEGLHQENLKETLHLIENALNHLEQKHLKLAMAEIEPLAKEHEGLFGEWLEEAKKRQILEETFSIFKARIQTFLGGGQ